MKPIKFKKWVIAAIVSAIIGIGLFIFGVVLGGASLVTSLATIEPQIESYIYEGLNEANGAVTVEKTITTDGNTTEVTTDTANTDTTTNDTTSTDGSTTKEVTIEKSTNNSTGNNCSTTVTVNGNTYSDECDDFEYTDSYDLFITLTDGYTFNTKADLDNYLADVVSVVNDNNLSFTGEMREDFVDELVDLVERQMVYSTIPSDARADEDFEDYFERTQLSNVDIDQYMESYLAKNL